MCLTLRPLKLTNDGGEVSADGRRIFGRRNKLPAI